MSYIRCDDLSLSYEGRSVIEHLSFAVGEGDFLCILGENGSGKTTLMKAMLGLKDPASGTVTRSVPKNSVGYLAQTAPAQKDFPASVREVVLSGRVAHGGLCPFYRAEDKKRAAEAMEAMKIADLAPRSFRTLSGGQQQRVLLARALCAAEKILFLDEPASGLDEAVTAELYRATKDANRRGLAVVMISHDPAAALDCATHILHIGSFVFYGTRDEYASVLLKKGANGGV